MKVTPVPTLFKIEVSEQEAYALSMFAIDNNLDGPASALAALLDDAMPRGEAYTMPVAGPVEVTKAT